jgi:preprotein translocase subunit SecE
VNNTAAIVTAVIVGVLFFWMWRAGHLARIRAYFQETREELHKCTWPSRDELKGSTVVVIVSVALVGAFTVGVDLVLVFFVRDLLLKL